MCATWDRQQGAGRSRSSSKLGVCEERGNHRVFSSLLPRWLETWALGVLGLMVIGRKLMTILLGDCAVREGTDEEKVHLYTLENSEFRWL